MDSAWDLPLGAEGFREQAWFIRLGRGASFRALSLPLGLTQRMEHFVRQAPDHYTASQALRYGETRGMGGREDLAREIARSRLGKKIERREFWRTVLGFFVNQSAMDLGHVQPIIDFVQAHKFAPEEMVTSETPVSRAPRWPEFSMHGRTLKSMLRLVAAWRAELAKGKLRNNVVWAASAIPGYRFLEPATEETREREWIIRELVESSDLHAEGLALRHCVYSYTAACHGGDTTIWSLRLRLKNGEKPLATIQIDPRRRAIIQVRAKCNQWPGERSENIIRQWAAAERLRFEDAA